MGDVQTNGSTQQDKGSVARRIASKHRELEPDIQEIYRIESPGREEALDEPIKLLEINPNTVARGILPVGLSSHAASGIPYASVIVEFHPSEWPDVRAGKLMLPHRWQIEARPL